MSWGQNTVTSADYMASRAILEAGNPPRRPSDPVVQREEFLAKMHVTAGE